MAGGRGPAPSCFLSEEGDERSVESCDKNRPRRRVWDEQWRGCRCVGNSSSVLSASSQPSPRTLVTRIVRASPVLL